jgi:hypothetical protein
VHAHGSVADFTPRAVFADNATDHNREVGRGAGQAKRDASRVRAYDMGGKDSNLDVVKAITDYASS